MVIVHQIAKKYLIDLSRGSVLLALFSEAEKAALHHDVSARIQLHGLFRV
tara:strand:+ start:314 stop:463 length:150 start_codon:yes stop_codon:yes gene_type:complete